jgi:hypothetical protein
MNEVRPNDLDEISHEEKSLIIETGVGVIGPSVN